MEAKLNIDTNGDYVICLSKEEIILLQKDVEIVGKITFTKNKISQDNTVSLQCKDCNTIRTIKNKSRSEGKSFFEGTCITVTRDYDKKHHAIFLTKEKIEDDLEALVNGDPNINYLEYRYDSIMFRKIFFYQQFSKLSPT